MGNGKAKVFDIRRLPMDAGRIVCSVLLPIFRMRRITPTGKKYNSKLKGGAVIAANHTSFADPFLVGVAFWYRRVFFLIAKEVMKGGLRSVLLKGMGGIKIDREKADIEAIKKSVEILKCGWVLSIFPQGGIDRQDGIDSIKSGAVLIALQAGVPIVPMYICPNKKWYSRRTVVIGEPIIPTDICKKKFPSTADIQEITGHLMEAMKKCSEMEIA